NPQEYENTLIVATNLQSKTMGKKGIIKIEGKILNKDEVNKISVIAPHATMNVIENYEVKEKTEVEIPDQVKRIIKCSNPDCITNNEPVDTWFYVLEKEPLKIKCHYCEKHVHKKDVKIL
ncbi:MAG: aspartate carbamoyltransferase regulatory subunit, partial [Phycisphaerales bacterium]|nr:aspartate carbamoyltransferase regulatory subunit [Phycisphaerales bacterium]